MIFVLILVVSFGSSGSLSDAYGIAVSGVMMVTVVLLAVVMWRVWKWHPLVTLAVMIPFLIVDIGFFVANVSKLFQGGWVPAAVAAVLASKEGIWMVGRRRLSERPAATRCRWSFSSRTSRKRSRPSWREPQCS